MDFIHINLHFGIGIIIASISKYFFQFNFFEFFLIVLFSFLCDFDIFFSKYALDNNHRMLITHSIIPGMIITVLGLILNWIVLIIAGISYVIHIIIDTFDWGTNFLYFQKKQIGFKLLITKDEYMNMSKYLAQYKKPESFFDKKYYGNAVCVIIEILIFILMILFISIFAFQYFLVITFYFIFLSFHLHRHIILKKIESD